jgi:hypothetical protein
MLSVYPIEQSIYNQRLKIMVKYIYVILLLSFISCQQQNNEKQLELNDKIAYQYVSNLYNQYEICDSCISETKKWRPPGSDTMVDVGALSSLIACASIVKPILKYEKWIENNAVFSKQAPITSLCMEMIIMMVPFGIEMAVTQSFLVDLWVSISNAHRYESKGAIATLDEIPNNHPLKKEFAAKIDSLIKGITYPATDSGIDLKIIVPESFYPYYNSKVIDKKWILDFYEKSGNYRKWLKKCKPFFDEIIKIYPDEEYGSYFYRCYNSPTIDSNLSVYKFTKMVNLK